jgi:guanosine-3',5'-bis(diphosphate) 3'-pyrophosphohydrolase
MSLILLAAELADLAHANQKRKWSGRPYIEHPMRVAGRVSLLEDVTEEEVAAAWLHDVFEDCPDFEESVKNGFPGRVQELVLELTNPSKKHPEISRKSRKALDRAHFVHVGRWAKIIKFVDRIDNIRDMSGAERGFKRLYLDESLLLANVLLDHTDPVNKRLYLELMTELAGAQ